MDYAWAMLLTAGFFEILMALSLKQSNGFTQLLPSAATVCTAFISFYTLSQSVKTLPMGTAYAIWTGIGAAGTAVIGIYFFGDSCHIMRILCLMLIILGVAGLKFFN